MTKCQLGIKTETENLTVKCRKPFSWDAARPASPAANMVGHADQRSLRVHWEPHVTSGLTSEDLRACM